VSVAEPVVRERALVAGALLTIAVVVAAPGAWSEESPEDAAQAAAESWLSMVDGGEYAKSWDEAAALFKKAVTREQWEQALHSVRGPLGSLVSREATSRQYTEQLPGAPAGRYVVLQFDAVFGKKPKAVETVTFMVDADGAWRASGYYIK